MFQLSYFNSLLSVVVHCGSVALYMSDITTLYPGRGISDAVIDFYVR